LRRYMERLGWGTVAILIVIVIVLSL